MRPTTGITLSGMTRIPKPAYLFACVVGDLDCARDSFVTASNRHVDLHIYVEKGNVGLIGHAMESLKKSMKWDEERFGLEYDLDLFQIVAVSHFNMGRWRIRVSIFSIANMCWLTFESTATDNDLDNVGRSSPANIFITGPATELPAVTGSN